MIKSINGVSTVVRFAERQQRRRILNRVLMAGRFRFQALLAMIGFTFGLVLLLGSINLTIGIHQATRHGEEHYEYLIVNKQVTLGGMLTHIRPTFTDREIDRLREQPFVEDVGEFITNRFQASAMASGHALSSNGETAVKGKVRVPGGAEMVLPLYTEMFFEAVPDRFLDVKVGNWHWTPDSAYLPIIMSREFLNLYNFSFALAQGLPQIPESLLGSVAGSVTVSGPGGRRVLRARVVGLSDRIPSIIVPESFMLWANEEVARDVQERPSRLVIKTNRPADPAMLDYFRQYRLQVNSERLRAGRVGRMAVMALAAVGVVGGFFVVLAFFLFILLSRLILAESGERIRMLLQLGYSPAILTFHVLRRFWLNLFVVAIITGSLMGTVFPFAYQRLRQAGFDPGPALLPVTAVTAIIILGIMGMANFLTVRKDIYRSVESNG